MERHFTPEALRSAARPTCLAAIAVLLLSSCAAEPGSPAEADTAEEAPTVTVENCGHEVSFDAVPERVVLLDSAPVTILDGLGVFDRVESRAGTFPQEYYEDDLAQKVSEVESFSEDLDASGHLMISQEEVITRDPDLVLGLPDGVTREALADAGAATLTQEIYCAGRGDDAEFEDIFAEITRYGEIFDREDEAEALNAELDERISAAGEAISEEGRTAAVLFPSAGGGSVYAYGTGSMAHPQLEAAGFENIFSDTGERVFEVQAEELITRDPDVIIVLHKGAEQDAESDLMQLPGVEGISAIADGEVHYQLFNFTEPASPLVVDGLERIADRFGDPSEDPED